MKCVVAVISIVCMVFVGAVRAEPASSTQQQIQLLLDKMLRLANAHDTDRFMAFYLHQPSLIYVHNGVVIHGWDALHAQQLKWWKNGKSDAVYRENGPTEFTVLAPDVVAVTEPRASTRSMPDGKVGSHEFVATEVFRKLPNGWRIVYGHESTVH